MSEDQARSTPNETTNDIIPISSTTEYVSDESGEQPKPPPKNNDCSHIDKEPINVVVNIPNDNKRTEYGIAIFGTLINLVLAGFTYLLYTKTVEANNTSAHALLQSTRANEISQASVKSTDSIGKANLKLAQDMFADQIESSIIKDSKDSITLSFTRSSLNAQIKSLNEAYIQFQKDNEPYIQVRFLKNIILTGGKPISFDYSIYNYGKYPAQAISGNDQMEYVERKDSIKFMKDPFKHLGKLNNVSMYITMQNPILAGFMLGGELPNEYYNRYKSGELLLYYISKLYYRNLINNKKRVFYTVIQFIHIQGISDSLYRTDITFNGNVK